jgi:hypothetical protein
MPLPPFVIPRFNPTEIPGLESWWDASDAASVTLDSGRISQLADKSGKGRHAANTTSGSTQPSYVTGARNGLNVARFAAASVQRLVVGSSTAAYNFLHNGTPSWVATVSAYGTSDNPGNVYVLFSNNNGASANVGAQFAYDDRGITTPPLNNAFNGQITTGAVGQFSANVFDPTNSNPISAYTDLLTPNTLLVQECVYSANESTASQKLRFRVNGGSEVAQNNKTNTGSTGNSTANMTIGASSSLAGPLQGDICEILIFSQIPTAAARDMIRRYLGAKWGVTVG